MGKYKNFKNLLDNPSIFNDVNDLQNEITDCFINFILEESVCISNNKDAIIFYKNNRNCTLFVYDKVTKELSFTNFIDNDCRNRITKLFNKINNE